MWASNKAFPTLTAFMQLLLLQNQLNNESHVHFIDSNFMVSALKRGLEAVAFTSGNVHDSKMVEQVTKT